MRNGLPSMFSFHAKPEPSSQTDSLSVLSDFVWHYSNQTCDKCGKTETELNLNEEIEASSWSFLLLGATCYI